MAGTRKRPGLTGVRPQRHLGQNFLTDERVLDAEIRYAGIAGDDTVLEVGAGIGNLTERLAARARHVIAIEVDQQFTARLESVARRCGNITMLWGDALAVRIPAFSKVAANLPYRVALPVIFMLLDHPFSTGVFMIQKDMAQKICAGPGEAGYGRVSVTVQRLAHTELLDTVPRSAFSPPPEVDSALLRVYPIREPFPVSSAEGFRRLLEHSFLQRDEKLIAALQRLDSDTGAASLLPGRLRNKQVSELAPEEFGEVSRFLDAHKVRLPATTRATKRRAQAVRKARA